MQPRAHHNLTNTQVSPVFLITGVQRDHVGWMAEMELGTESYTLREAPCPIEDIR